MPSPAVVLEEGVGLHEKEVRGVRIGQLRLLKPLDLPEFSFNVSYDPLCNALVFCMSSEYQNGL